MIWTKKKESAQRSIRRFITVCIAACKWNSKWKTNNNNVYELNEAKGNKNEKLLCYLERFWFDFLLSFDQFVVILFPFVGFYRLTNRLSGLL